MATQLKQRQAQNARTFVVTPAARRCGVDDQPTVDGVRSSADFDGLVQKVQDTQEFIAVTDRVLNFAQLADQELIKLQQSVLSKDAVGLEKSGQRLAGLASEVGAADLIRACYQMLINVRQGDEMRGYALAASVAEEYQKLRKTLRLQN